MEHFFNSGNLEKLSWTDNTLTLYYHSGMIVNYLNVPEGIAVGMSLAPSAGSYMRHYVCGVFGYKIAKGSDVEHENKLLMHHKDTTCGLWATDRPDLIPAEIKDMFFEITYSNHPTV